MGHRRLEIMQSWDEMVAIVAKAEGYDPLALRAQEIGDFLVTLSNYEKHKNNGKDRT